MMSTQPHVVPYFVGLEINYRELAVWSRSMDLVEVCYQLSRRLPQSEAYGLASQIRRAAVSIPANIAEGHGRRSLSEYIQHLSIANGSLEELETHLMISGRIDYLEENEIISALEASAEIGRMLGSLIENLRDKRA
ncbi:MAG TPA: four helix bundle protein [Candidatus Acidoferrales bacterium]|nr:four helix bundle protein [Candidatus Acidoferrales bacterium]